MKWLNCLTISVCNKAQSKEPAGVGICWRTYQPWSMVMVLFSCGTQQVLNCGYILANWDWWSCPHSLTRLYFNEAWFSCKPLCPEAFYLFIWKVIFQYSVLLQSFPFFGVVPALLDESGKEIKGSGEGYLVFRRPWPGIMRTLFGNHERFETTYFKKFPGYYCTGDGKSSIQICYFLFFCNVNVI